MKEITKQMIKEYKINKLGFDFMGYETRKNGMSFHHLIVPRQNCKKEGLGEGYLKWNGAILTQSTAHDYLHTIERYDLDMFLYITSEMIDENIKGYLDIENILKIYGVLEQFEREYAGSRTNSGRPVIKEEYVRKRVLKR